jgi:hypothetical protein
MMTQPNEAMPQFIVYQIKVTLNGSKPPIWRRIQVRADTTLAKLHTILQIVMGWANYHLHAFRIDSIDYGENSPELPMRSDKRTRLYQVIHGAKFRFRYEYDFGDSWEHVLVVERILPLEPDAHYPRCLAGKRACPPEDVGGVWGYMAFLEAIGNPEHPEHEQLLEWIGDEFDPEAFDLEAVNRELAKFR